jgi:glutathione synthase
MAKSSLKVGMVMDPIASISPKKDSSLAMLLEASHRAADIYYFEQQDLRMLSGVAMGTSTRLTVRDDSDNWFDFGERAEIELGDLDVILMRKDPPLVLLYFPVQEVFIRIDFNFMYGIKNLIELRNI